MDTLEYDVMAHEWNKTGYPIASPTTFSWDDVKYIAIHWPGAEKRPARTDIEWLNLTQKYYIEDPNRGYSFGYSSAVSNIDGRTFQGRGLNFRAASNGDSKRGDDLQPGNPQLLDNKEVFSILVLVTIGEELTEQCKAGVRKLVKQLLAIKPSLKIVGHGELDATECPGPACREAILRNEFLPVIETPVENPDLGDTTMRVLWAHKNYANTFLVNMDLLTVMPLTPELFELETKKGTPLIVEDHQQFLEFCVESTFLEMTDLVPVKR